MVLRRHRVRSQFATLAKQAGAESCWHSPLHPTFRVGSTAWGWILSSPPPLTLSWCFRACGGRQSCWSNPTPTKPSWSFAVRSVKVPLKETLWLRWWCWGLVQLASPHCCGDSTTGVLTRISSLRMGCTLVRDAGVAVSITCMLHYACDDHIVIPTPLSPSVTPLHTWCSHQDCCTLRLAVSGCQGIHHRHRRLRQSIPCVVVHNDGVEPNRQACVSVR